MSPHEPPACAPAWPNHLHVPAGMRPPASAVAAPAGTVISGRIGGPIRVDGRVMIAARDPGRAGGIGFVSDEGTMGSVVISIEPA
jgi:hypothetical protein